MRIDNPAGRRRAIFTAISLSVLLSACEAEQEAATGNALADDTATAEQDFKKACAAYPDLPFCKHEPRPGAAKFEVGSASSLQWSGRVGCDEVDLRSGRDKQKELTIVEGSVKYVCGEQPDAFSFVHYQYGAQAGGRWTTAFQPLSEESAQQLLRSCSSDSLPPASALIGKWWHANNTYAENLILKYKTPLVLASNLLPFDDDGFERLPDETMDGEKVIPFRTESATVWMLANSEDNRPLRTAHTNTPTDITFSNWDSAELATIPSDLHKLEEICVTD